MMATELESTSTLGPETQRHRLILTVKSTEGNETDRPDKKVTGKDWDEWDVEIINWEDDKWMIEQPC